MLRRPSLRMKTYQKHCNAIDIEGGIAAIRVPMVGLKEIVHPVLVEIVVAAPVSVSALQKTLLSFKTHAKV